MCFTTLRWWPISLLIPPRLLTSKALALWRSRTECDWEIWKSIFSQSTHLPWGDCIWFFSPTSSASLVVSQWTAGFVPRGKPKDPNWISSLSKSQEPFPHRTRRLIPEIPFSSAAVMMVYFSALKPCHSFVLQFAWKWTMSHVWPTVELVCPRKVIAE